MQSVGSFRCWWWYIVEGIAEGRLLFNAGSLIATYSRCTPWHLLSSSIHASHVFQIGFWEPLIFHSTHPDNVSSPLINFPEENIANFFLSLSTAKESFCRLHQAATYLPLSATPPSSLPATFLLWIFSNTFQVSPLHLFFITQLKAFITQSPQLTAKSLFAAYATVCTAAFLTESVRLAVTTKTGRKPL